MKFATNFAVFFGLTAIAPLAVLADGMRYNVLRQAVVRAGLVPFQETHVEVSSNLVTVGKLLFQTKDISLDRKTACASCHVDRFGSGDGIANAVGTGGQGEGLERLAGGGDIIPRNTLPFWGRGSKGFDVFFWDGKVDASSGTVRSQFAGDEPSTDPLVVAAHLPPVEVGEMVARSRAERLPRGGERRSCGRSVRDACRPDSRPSGYWTRTRSSQRQEGRGSRIS